ncbi:hypothetical protein HZA56_22830 [Candidatus Poribacteria bacterium]|nr:hypothetical protein [Candidatus Poribacteria bacterium]
MNTYAVTYVLHETYYEPVREVRNGQNNVEEKTTAYGDYTIRARIRNPNEVQTVQVDLSDALEKEYSDSDNPRIDEALQLIRKY